MSSSLFVNAHTNFSCQISFCIFRYWENGQLFLKYLTRIAVHALLKNLSVNISKQRGKALKTHGLSWNAWKYLVPALWGRETFLCEQLFLSWPLLCQLGHCFFILPSGSSSLFFLSIWSCKVLEKVLCTTCTLSLVWSRTIKLLKDLLILLNLKTIWKIVTLGW